MYKIIHLPTATFVKETGWYGKRQDVSFNNKSKALETLTEYYIYRVKNDFQNPNINSYIVYRTKWISGYSSTEPEPKHLFEIIEV